MTKRMIVLAGSPEYVDLVWGDENILQDVLQPRVQRFLGIAVGKANEQETSTFIATPEPKWRLVPMPGDLHDEQQAPSLTAVSTPGEILKALPTIEDGAVYTDYLDHSFALLEEAEISPHASHSFTPTTSITTTATSQSTPSPHNPPLPHLNQPITALSTLPTAHHLQNLHPQTLTVTLLVAIISATPPRTIVPRRPPRYQDPNQPHRQVELIELLVADETRAGVGVTFWLDHPDEHPGVGGIGQAGRATTRLAKRNGEKLAEVKHEQRSVVEGLRTGDVVVLQNVALAVYKGVVFGRSLGWWRGCGTVVHRIRGGEALSGGSDLVLKVRRVREWVGQFLGRGGRKRGTADEDEAADGNGGQRKRGRKEGLEDLPPDTQDSEVG